MADGLRLEDWIGESVTVNVYTAAEGSSRKTGFEGAEVVSDVEKTSERMEVVGVNGFLEGVDPHGVIVLWDPRDAATRLGPLSSPDPENTPRHVFLPWQRISVIEHIVPQAE